MADWLEHRTQVWKVPGSDTPTQPTTDPESVPDGAKPRTASGTGRTL